MVLLTLGYVYVITTDEYVKSNIYKIGFSKDLTRRLKTLNATRLLNDQFYAVTHWRTVNYKELETGLHQTLKQYRRNNEFFECPFEKILEAIEIFLAGKSSSFIHNDVILIEAGERNTKWLPAKKQFRIDSGDIQIMMNEQRMIEEIKAWIDPFDRCNLYRYAHRSFWDNLLTVVKTNFEERDCELVVNNVDEEELALINLSLLSLGDSSLGDSEENTEDDLQQRMGSLSITENQEENNEN